MHPRNLDLIVIMTIVAMNVIWVLYPIHIAVVGIILAVPFVCFLPGYVITEVLSHNHTLDTVYRFILSLGLSLALDILGGLALNIFPVGLRATSWVILLGLLISIFSLLIVYRRRSYLPKEIDLPKPKLRLHWYEYILVGLAVLVLGLSIQYSIMSEIQRPGAGFTQVWMLPPTKANTCAVRLGVRSFETTSVTYRITMTVNSVQVNTWPTVALAPQEEWGQSVVITPSISGDRSYVEILLYKSDKPETVYRQVHLTLISSTGNKKPVIACVSS